MTARLDKLSFDEGLDVIARVAMPIGLLKRAEGLGIPGVSEALAKIPPEVQQALMPALAGAGVGAGLGGLSSLWQPEGRRKPISRMLTGGMLGGMMGGAYPFARDMAKGFDPGQFALKSNQPDHFRQIDNQSQVDQWLPSPNSPQIQQPAVDKAIQDLTVGATPDKTDLIPPAAGAAAFGLAGRDPGITDRDALRKLLTESNPGNLNTDVQQSIRETYDRLLGTGIGEDQAQKAILSHGTGALQNHQQQLTQSLLDANRRSNSAMQDARAIQSQGRPAGMALSQARELQDAAGHTANTVAEASRKLNVSTPVNGRQISGKELGSRGWMPSLTSKQSPLESIRRATPRQFNPVRGVAAGIGTDLLTRLILNRLQGSPQQ